MKSAIGAEKGEFFLLKTARRHSMESIRATVPPPFHFSASVQSKLLPPWEGVSPSFETEDWAVRFIPAMRHILNSGNLNLREGSSAIHSSKYSVGLRSMEDFTES